MADKWYWIGDRGPFRYDDTKDVNDPNGVMAVGTKQAVIVSDGDANFNAMTGDQTMDSITLTDLTASTLILANATKELISHTKDSHIADASTAHATASFANVNTALDAIGTIINAILVAIENANLTETS